MPKTMSAGNVQCEKELVLLQWPIGLREPWLSKNPHGCSKVVAHVFFMSQPEVLLLTKGAFGFHTIPSRTMEVSEVPQDMVRILVGATFNNLPEVTDRWIRHYQVIGVHVEGDVAHLLVRADVLHYASLFPEDIMAVTEVNFSKHLTGLTASLVAAGLGWSLPIYAKKQKQLQAA